MGSAGVVPVRGQHCRQHQAPGKAVQEAQQGHGREAQERQDREFPARGEHVAGGVVVLQAQLGPDRGVDAGRHGAGALPVHAVLWVHVRGGEGGVLQPAAHGQGQTEDRGAGGQGHGCDPQDEDRVRVQEVLRQLPAGGCVRILHGTVEDVRLLHGHGAQPDEPVLVHGCSQQRPDARAHVVREGVHDSHGHDVPGVRSHADTVRGVRQHDCHIQESHIPLSAHIPCGQGRGGGK